MKGMDELGTITLPLHRNMESVEVVINVRDIIVPQLDSLQNMHRDGSSSRVLEVQKISYRHAWYHPLNIF